MPEFSFADVLRANGYDAESAFWCHVCMKTVPPSQAATHEHDPGADGPR